ncbi:MAG TPA: NAD(P)-binding domain-containing protein [Acidobacteriota bacterium]|nr:NAD(P)-binding domain-containing protein [Acidobacteriota bacterium]
MANLLTYIIYVLLIAIPLAVYVKRMKRKEALAREAAEKGKLYSEGPKAQHPQIDTAHCIGCGTCTEVCPEGDVLAVFAGKAVIINGYKCIGHGLCADACPVGAIEMVMAHPSVGADMPFMTPERETNIPNLFIVGELGGMALIKNAVNEGRDCVDTIKRRIEAAGAKQSAPGVFDICIVGAGPAGISASLRAIESKLSYITLEQDEEVGGTVAKYPRQKLVMTSPVRLPMYGNFRKLELSKEDLLELWNKIFQRADFKVRRGEKVEEIKRNDDGVFTVVTTKGQYLSRAVILALGRRGTPRKLGVKGEELSKVMYSLIEADHYTCKKILVVGGGDSAIEAAMGLGHQRGNEVTLSYRKESFSRIKERNMQRIQECMRNGKVNVVFNSSPIEIKENSVILDVGGEPREIPNDFVWVFAGGIPPNAFLQKIGVAFGTRDMTLEASTEARNAALAGKQLIGA